MDKLGLFKGALSKMDEFAKYPQEELISMGQFLGADQVAFKDVTKAYLNRESSYENNPIFGSKIEIVFEWEADRIVMKRLAEELEFNVSTFLEFLNLIDICFTEIYPIGSVVEIDLDVIPSEFQEMFKERKLLVSIAGRKVPLSDDYGYYTDYIGYLWPFGIGKLTEPFFISNVTIKRVVHTGFVDEVEEEFVNKVLRSDVIDGQEKSMIFLSDEEKETYEADEEVQ